jgi:inorganic phosphate transporter, PiT family
MGTETVLMGIALVFGLYMAWSIGANDVANAMGTSVGSGALTIKRAVILAAILEFSGAFLVGSHVSETVRKGIINPDIFTAEPLYLVYGMMAALLAAGMWLQLASYYGWPVSTTHSIVGSVLGFGIVVGGMEAANWGKVGEIVSSWVISPLLSGTIAFLIFRLIRRKIFFSNNPVKSAKKLTPYLVFFVFMILTLVMVFKGLKNLNMDLSFTNAMLVAIIVGLIAAFISRILVEKIKVEHIPERTKEYQDPKVVNNLKKALKILAKAQKASTGDVIAKLENIKTNLNIISKRMKFGEDVEHGTSQYQTVEKIFVYLQILSAAFVAFAHGANDVANAVGPLAAVVSVLQTGIVSLKSQVPLWILGLGGVGIVVGLATWGWRVIETIGKKITELTPTRGFAAEFAAATTIVFASKLGLPISTTHTLVGAVLGVGLARGIGALNLKTIRDIIISWIVTIPMGAVLAIIFFYIFKAIF